MPLQNEEAAQIATFSQKSPPAKKQKKGLMQVFRLRAAIFRKYPHALKKTQVFLLKGKGKQRKAKKIRVEYLCLVSLFLLKGKEGFICQHPDAGAVNSSKYQRRVVSSQKLHSSRKGGALERWSWKLRRCHK